MVSDFSEEGGYFRFEYMSNEREFQYVIPRLKATIKPGGTYLRSRAGAEFHLYRGDPTENGIHISTFGVKTWSNI